MTRHGRPATTDTAGSQARGAELSGRGVRGARTRIVEIVAVCTRCAKRQGLRKKDVRDRMKRAAKRAARQARAAGGGSTGVEIRVVETGCLGPCPKRALAVATGASLAAGRVLLLEPDMGVGAMASALLPAVRDRGGVAGRETGEGLPFATHSCDDPVAPSPDRAPIPGRPGTPPPTA